MSKLIKGTHHIAIKCADKKMFDAVKSFYCDVLGLELLRSWGEGEGSGMMLGTGNSILEVFACGGSAAKDAAVNHFALATDDVDACVKAVSDAGYTITVEPKDICIPAEKPFPARIAFCIGAAGEEIEFFCEK